MNTHQSNAQGSNKSRPQDPTSAAQQSADPAPEGHVPPGRGTPVMARTGLASGSPQEVEAKVMEDPVLTSIGLTDSGSESGPVGAESCGHTTCVEASELSAKGLSDPAPVDPHEVRTRLAVHGSVHGLELDTGTGVVFIPQHALPDLRRRLLLAQERFTAMSGPLPGKRRKRRPASAR